MRPLRPLAVQPLVDVAAEGTVEKGAHAREQGGIDDVGGQRHLKRLLEPALALQLSAARALLRRQPAPGLEAVLLLPAHLDAHAVEIDQPRHPFRVLERVEERQRGAPRVPRHHAALQAPVRAERVDVAQ